MPKLLAIATIGMFAFLINVGEASAQGRNISGDYVRCPDNTCAPSGGQRAKNTSYCKASNCKKGASK